MLQGYRTYIVAFLVAVFGALAVLDWNTVITDPKVGWTMVINAIIFAVLRSITTTPPGAQTPK